MGTRELIKLLSCLGYKQEKQAGSKHLKYSCPSSKIIHKGIRPFIVVIQGKNNYDPFWQREYIKQIKKHGFTQEEINKCGD